MSEDLLQKLFTKLVEIESNMATKEDIKSLKDKIDGVSEQVVINAEGISAVNDKLEKLDGTIDLLSRRSIDQEAALKRIK